MRKERDKVRKASKKASETREQTLHKQEQKWRTHYTQARTETELNTSGKHESF